MTSSMPATELIVVRHGETVWNANGRQQGHLDGELNERGHEQAEAIAQRLSNESFDVLVSSDLGRAMQTARHIADRTRHEIIPDARLRERHLGIFQGLTLAQAAEQFPEVHRRFSGNDPDFIIPDGESRRQTHERVIAGASAIAEQHTGERIVVVGHGGVLTSLFRHTLGLPIGGPRTFKLFNASYNTFFITDGQWQLGIWGDVSHLAGFGTEDDW